MIGDVVGPPAGANCAKDEVDPCFSFTVQVADNR